MYAALAEKGCLVMTCTFPLPTVGLTRRLTQRLPDLNAAIREAATRQGALIVDLERVDIASDPRLYSPDRLHLNSDGHARLAGAFEATLSGATNHQWTAPLPPLPPSSPSRRLVAETKWIVRYLVPKLIRTARGRSSGDGCSAKRPGLSPIVGR
jgi:hypothetical protein